MCSLKIDLRKSPRIQSRERKKTYERKVDVEDTVKKVQCTANRSSKRKGNKVGYGDT